MSSALAAALGFSVATGPLVLPSSDFVGAFDSPPTLIWQRPLPGPKVPAATHTELGTPVLRGGHIYVGSAADDALLVLDRADGRLVERLPAKGLVQSAPVVTDDRVFFSDTGGVTSCYTLGDDGDSQLTWQHESSGPILSTPLVHQDQVIVATLGNVVTSLDIDTGEFQWRHSQKVDRTLAGPQLYGAPTPTPVSLDGTAAVLTGFADGTLVALTADAGEVLWQRRVGEGSYPDLIGRPVALADGIVAGGFGGPLLALDPTSRAVRWRVDVGSAAAPSLGDIDPVSGLPVLYHAGIDGKLRAIDARTGELRWTWDSLTQGALTQPVVTDAGLLVGSSSGGLYLIDPVAGKRRWKLDAGYVLAGVSARPAVDGRQAVIVTNAGRLLSLVVDQPLSPAAIGDGDFVRVGGQDGSAPGTAPAGRSDVR